MMVVSLIMMIVSASEPSATTIGPLRYEHATFIQDIVVSREVDETALLNRVLVVVRT